MKKALIFCIFAMGYAAVCMAQDFSLYEKHVYEQSGKELPYRLLRPENCDTTRSYPLFVYSHGMGKRGVDNESQLKLGAWLFLTDEARTEYPCYVLYPQADKTFVEIVEGDKRTAGSFNGFIRKYMSGEDITVELSETGHMAYGLINSIIAENNIDRNRIYIAGSSMGSFTTYRMIADYPEMFAAAVPMGGATDLRLVEKWKNEVPVWIVHGLEDPAVAPDIDEKIVDILKKDGVECRYDFYPDCAHDCWTRTFAEKKDFLKWIFSHSK